MLHRHATTGSALLSAAIAVLASCAAQTPRDGSIAQEAVAEQRLASAASAFLATLDDAQRAQAVQPLDSAAMRDWHYVPRERPGLALAQMDPVQKGALHDLLHAALDAQGYLQVTGVVRLESLLHEMESRPGAPATLRDPGRYAIVFFGTPGEGAWAWRFEGHHVSVHFASTEDATTHTPFFVGANPARVPMGPEAGWRIFAAEEDLGRELFLALDDAQRARATLPGAVPTDVILGPGQDRGFEEQQGLAHADMDDRQRVLCERLLAQVVDDLEPDLAAREWARIRANGLGRVHFAWCGGTRPGEPHYWRLHGPHFVVEYDNVQGGANHVHVLWRDLERDFGGDVLRRHRVEDHAHDAR